MHEASSDPRFAWTPFYEEFADILLGYRDRRPELLAEIGALAETQPLLNYLHRDQFADGSKGFLRDICPFTVMGMFNRTIKDENRVAIAADLGRILGVQAAPPQRFDGIPRLDARSSWFFGFDKDRGPEIIDTLWELFARALAYAAPNSPQDRAGFATAFDNAGNVKGAKWNLTFGLFWIRPWYYTPMDDCIRDYIKKNKARLPTVPIVRDSQLCSGEEYLAVRDALAAHFPQTDSLAPSFPAFSADAWEQDDEPAAATAVPAAAVPAAATTTATAVAYSIDDIFADGCFAERAEVERMLERLRAKRNLILQGPPGTGKTWLAKRLGYALMGEKATTHMGAVQFHPNVSYEDFVQGWRPDGDGKLKLVKGPFLKLAEQAKQDPDHPYVMVIEEVNRGNPAQIFGELLTLLEASKRTPDDALKLTYAADGELSVYLPANLYVIGTMNLADRSLALVDIALRRRFAFVTLAPALGTAWQRWATDKGGIDRALVARVKQRIEELNTIIANDASLGVQFCVGHSFVTPTAAVADAQAWFASVVATEIAPLLEEYWYDEQSKARAAIAALHKDL